MNNSNHSVLELEMEVVQGVKPCACACACALSPSLLTCYSSSEMDFPTEAPAVSLGGSVSRRHYRGLRRV